jgi:hypothetical protein
MGIQTVKLATSIINTSVTTASTGSTGKAGFEIYYRYGSFDVSDLQRNNKPMLNDILRGLSEITGLMFNVDPNGILGYSRVRRIGSTGSGIVGHIRARGYSRYARKLVIKMLETSSHTYVNDIGSSPTAGSSGSYVDPFDPEAMYLDMLDGEEAINGASDNLNPETFSMAMIMLHEWGHTSAGGEKDDESRDPVTLDRIEHDHQGMNEKYHKYNRIRRQMSKESNGSWGYRRTYSPYNIGGVSYLAFNNKARRALMRAIYKGKPLKFSKGAKYIKYP